LKAFGTKRLYFYKFAPLSRETEALLGVRNAGSLDAVLREADIVTLHLPLTGETRGMIDADALASMKAARGGLVDERALASALSSGRLAAAGSTSSRKSRFRGRAHSSTCRTSC